MNIQTEIERIKANIAAAYAKITTKGGSVPSAKTSGNLAAAIESIPVGGGTDTSDATAAADDILSGKTAYVKGAKVTGTIAAAGTITGDLGVTGGASWNSGGISGSGTVTIKNVHQTAGYTSGYNNGTLTVNVPNNRLLNGRTVMPSTVSQKIANAEDIAYGAISVAGDANLVAGNIKKGVSIFGVSGTAEEGVDTSEATAAAGDILSGKSAYVKGAKVTGTIASKGAADLTDSGVSVTVPAGYYPVQVSKSVATAAQATPAASIDKTTGEVTASATQAAGYVAAGTKTGTLQLTTQAAQTITPGKVDQTIASGKYLTGTQTIKGDANLKASNIRSGVSIFGVTGSYSPVFDYYVIENISAGGKTGITFTLPSYVNIDGVTGFIAFQASAFEGTITVANDVFAAVKGDDWYSTINTPTTSGAFGSGATPKQYAEGMVTINADTREVTWTLSESDSFLPGTIMQVLCAYFH